MTEKLMTAQEVADYLSVSVQTLRQIVKDGKIHCTRVGNKYRFTSRDIEAYLNGETTTPEVDDNQINADVGDDDDFLNMTELEQVEREIALASKRKELAEINNSLISRDELNEALDEINKRDAEVADREHALELALKEANQSKQSVIDEIEARVAEFTKKYGDISKIEDTIAKLEQDKLDVKGKLANAEKQVAECEDLKRVIKAVIIQYCGDDVWYEVATRINKIVMSRQKAEQQNKSR